MTRHTLHHFGLRTRPFARCAAWLILGLGVLIPSSLFAQPVAQELPEVTNRRCLSCHGQAHIADLLPHERLMMVGLQPGDHPIPPTGEEPPPPLVDLTGEEPETRPELYLALETLRGGPHRSLRCIQCHTDAIDLPHARDLNISTCTTGCHEEQEKLYLRGSHAEAMAREDPQAPGCATCHGGHNILPKTDRASTLHPFNIVNICSDCHEKHVDQPEDSPRVEAYLGSAHGQAVTRGGLILAATCANCHGSHDVRPADDPESKVHREHIPVTCGTCHLGIIETYAKSIHGQKLAEGDEQAPVCIDCHTAHTITRATTPDFMLDIVEECGSCHNDPEIAGERRASFFETYRASYHGQVTKLGSTVAARCSDCHGSHDIMPIDDPRSRLFNDHRVQVCRHCHENANAKFILFDPHADFRDGERFPVLHAVWLYFVIIMSVVFSIFGLHSLLWFGRTVVDRIRFGPAKHNGSPHAIRRFTAVNRFNHALVIITFFGLTLTGVPLLFAHQDWAHPLVRAFGGPVSAGIWHRVFAVMLMFNFAIHFLSLIRSARECRGHLFREWVFGPRSLLPKWRDVTDFIGMFRWFFGLGPKPKFDRWTYWEKFDYWSEIFGTFIIGGSGLMLWFPAFFSQIVPGWAFNIANIVHGYEALLALGFIFTIHFFNAHLRMDKFPVDDVMFTGRVPEAEFKEDRPLEYERLVKQGKLEQMYIPRAPHWQRIASIIIGIIAMLVGLGLVALIILAGLDAL